ncbi:hypothetical protein HNQ07_002909 [Deinococcus metalli]|uniref:Uncharacterized protein n=1 Tax=Deinococcus metalli TaxID=1141878 RepID=A0A7W8KFZ4_9DEIO|nr:hypothetical protein [Deinococcus metalli]MBB5377417.1 hypothetical protein [Deinococcus metalli]
MSAPAPDFPTFPARTFLPAFLLGWGLGTALTFALRTLGGALLTSPCQGHTLLALLLPLLMGPGGLAFTAAHWRRPRRAALGLGLVVASLLPALYVGARDIAVLRGEGCAGGYIVFASAGGSSVSTLSLPAGSARDLTGRVGGYTPGTHPGVFTLEAQSSTPGLQVSLPRTTVRAGEVFPVRITAVPSAGVNTYTVGVRATTTQDGRTATASSSLEVDVRPAPRP